jgi:hypothetical protein
MKAIKILPLLLGLMMVGCITTPDEYQNPKGDYMELRWLHSVVYDPIRGDPLDTIYADQSESLVFTFGSDARRNSGFAGNLIITQNENVALIVLYGLKYDLGYVDFIIANNHIPLKRYWTIELEGNQALGLAEFYNGEYGIVGQLIGSGIHPSYNELFNNTTIAYFEKIE